MIEARFYIPEDKGRVRCQLCPHLCLVNEGRTGICGVRQNRGGKLYSLVWGKPVAMHIDPVEKKPLFHFYPGSPIFSLATVGCNFRCRHCQNADISQVRGESGRTAGRSVAPVEVVRQAEMSGCRSIAYTYTEPTIYYEYACDIAVSAREMGMTNVFVTNGYIESEPQRAVARYLDAANIDLKSFRDDFYSRVCGGRLKPVLDSITLYRELGVWIEITTLVIPGLNDTEAELRDIARFIRGLGPEIPWHISRFHPDYMMTDRPITPLETLNRAGEIGREEGLLYVYLGNVPGGAGEDTICPGCRRAVIRRMNYVLGDYRIDEGKCSYCGHVVHGIGL